MRKLLIAATLFTCSYMNTFAQNSPIVPSVQVTGEAHISIVPDYATLTLGAETKDSNAEKSKKQNDQIISKALQILKKAGIADKHIQTQRLNLNKRRDYETKEDYFVTNQTVVVDLHHLDKYDALMADLIAAGVNVIHGIEFKSTKTAEQEAEIRKQAMLDAQKKATDYANALNQQIGKAIHISDQPVQMVRPMVYAMKSTEGYMDTTIAEGEIKITNIVQVTFELK